MDFRDSPGEADFRAEVRSFIEGELPPELRWRGGLRSGLDASRALYGGDAARAWHRKIAERGWTAPAWPREYGGAGMSVMEQFIFNEEMAQARAPRTGGGIAIGMAGPTIMAHGTEEQKRRFLPPMLTGGQVWCQGFSEPNAGSDLANVETAAVRDGDDFVINGQKIWTSQAEKAHWMNLLARTNPDVPKHKGISYFLLDMKSPGITVRPLVNMVGQAEFNQVFLDNVRVPKENLLGEENRGWYLAAMTLDFERSNIASTTHLVLTVSDLVAWVREHANAPGCAQRTNAKLRYELADRYVEAQIARLMSYRIVSMQNAGLLPNKESSVAKLYASELEQRIALSALKAAGVHGQLLEPSETLQAARMYLYSVAMTIGGGTSEIQRSIIAMRGLGLPRA